MRIQDLFTLVFILTASAGTPVLGAVKATPHPSSSPTVSPSPSTSPSTSPSMAPIADKCFDFTNKIDQVLRPSLSALPSASQGLLNITDGKDGVFWGTLTGDVHLPVRNVYFLLSDHNNTKSSRVEKMNVSEDMDPHFLLRQKVHFEVDPFPFVSVEWDEQWAFTLLGGTPDKPTKMLISYEKTDGTSHIRHLCGSILLTQIDPLNTRVLLYEEVQATNQSQGDTVSGLKGKLKTLQSHAP